MEVRWLRRAWAVLALILMVMVALPAPHAAAAPGEPRFKEPVGTAPVALSADVLTPEERAFLQKLPEVRVAVQRDGLAPYERVDVDGTVSGIQAEMLGTLARTFGLRLKPVVLDGRVAVLDAIAKGQADLVLTVAATAERLPQMHFTLGTVRVPVAVIGPSGRGPKVAAEHGRIALEQGHAMQGLVERRFPNASLVQAESTIEALRLVSRGEADAYVGGLLAAVDLMSREKVPGIEIREILGGGLGYYHFGVRKDWPLLVPVLNKGISSWRAAPEGPDAAAATLAASAVPRGVTLGASLPLSPEEAEQLARRSIWRVGGVRGLDPLNAIDAQGNHSGIAADYSEQVARRLGVAVEVVPFNTAGEMLDALRAGRIDVVPFIARTAEREREFAFSRAYLSMPFVLVGRTDAPMYWGLSSLAGKKLALAPQHPLRELVARRYPQIEVVDPRDSREALDMVAASEADAAAEVKLLANLRVNDDGAGALRVLGEIPEMPAEAYFATSQQARALVPLIDRAIGDINEADRERMLRRWVAIDLEPPFPWRRWAPTIAVATLAVLLVVGGTVWWMRRLQQEVTRRRRADEQLDDIGRTIPGVAFRYVMGAKGRVARTFYSSGAPTFFGFTPSSGKTLVSLLRPYLDADVWAAADAAQTESMRTGQRFRFSAPWNHPSGEKRWLKTEAVRSTTQGGHSAWTGYVIDVSTEHALQDRLAQEARERHLMLASASHELRAPTHTLALALQDPALNPAPGVLPPEADRLLGVARDAARTLTHLLDDVLDSARLDAGRLEVRPQAFELRPLLAQTVESHRGMAAARRLTLEWHGTPDLPRTLHTDPLRLRQVLTNLLSNALKYTREGGVVLNASVAEGALRLEVADTGPGIPPRQQERLFEPFVTLPGELSGADGSGAADAGGTAAPSSGLGLSICRRLVTLMGGRIALHSRPGAGTRVVVTLPIAPGSAPTAFAGSGDVLLCDDDDVSRTLLAAALERAGYGVLQAADGAAALARWQRGGVRALITDLTMPGLGGEALVAAIRRAEAESGAAQRTAIIVCSGVVPSVDALSADGGALACDAFVPKPVDLQALTDTMRRLLG